MIVSIGVIVQLMVQRKAGVPDDDLLPPRVLDELGKVLVIHGIDLAGTADNRRIGESVRNLLHDRTVRAGIEGGGNDGGNLEEVGEPDEAEHVVAELIGSEVTDKGDKSRLRFTVSATPRVALCRG